MRLYNPQLTYISLPFEVVAPCTASSRLLNVGAAPTDGKVANYGGLKFRIVR